MTVSLHTMAPSVFLSMGRRREGDMTELHDDWDRRVLCSDGNCIGVIGPDGRCKECGRAYDGDLPVGGDVGKAPENEDEPPRSATDGADPGGPGPDDDIAADDDGPDDRWENRTLCIDESCIGVVGPDGRCKECGKPYPE
jgi:hypothetical protein